MTLCQFINGAQRNQYVLQIKLGDIYWCEDNLAYMQKLVPEKQPRKMFITEIPLSPWLGKLFFLMLNQLAELVLFFENKIRKFLFPTKKNQGLWVSTNGNCLSKL